MLKILRSVLAVIIIVLASYGIIAQNFRFMTHLMLLGGSLMLINGLAEVIEDRKSSIGYAFVLVSFFIFFVYIQDIL